MAGTGSRPGTKTALATALVIAVAVVLAGGIAFACTAQANLNSSVTRGEAGTNAEITGRGFVPAPAGEPVALRWNGVNGAPLAQVAPDETGNIVAAVTVPADAAPGSYIITAVQREVTESGTETFRRNNVAFEVVGPPVAPPATQEQPAPQPAAAAAPAPATAPQAAAAPVGSGAVADSSRTAPARAAGVPAAAPAQDPTTPAPVAVAGPEVAPVPAPAAPAPDAVRPARVADQPTVAVTMKARSSSDASPWLAPMILVGVALAVASTAIVAKDSRRRRVETVKAEVNKLG